MELDDSLQSVKQAAFLSAYAECGNITGAARVADVDRTTHYWWLANDESGEYKKAFEAAHEAAIDALEAEARRRAVEGIEKAVGWHKGEAGGYETVYSDTLLIFLLKGARPDKYRDNVRQEIHGLPAPQVTEQNLNLIFSEMESSPIGQKLLEFVKEKEASIIDVTPKNGNGNGNGYHK